MKFVEHDYEKYIKEPYASVFKVYVDASPEQLGADLQIALCSAAEVCVQKLEGGIATTEIYRTSTTTKDGSITFAIPPEYFPKRVSSNPLSPRRGILIWSHTVIDESLRSVELSNTQSTVDIPALGKNADYFLEIL